MDDTGATLVIRKISTFGDVDSRGIVSNSLLLFDIHDTCIVENMRIMRSSNYAVRKRFINEVYKARGVQGVNLLFSELKSQLTEKSLLNLTSLPNTMGFTSSRTGNARSLVELTSQDKLCNTLMELGVRFTHTCPNTVFNVKDKAILCELYEKRHALAKYKYGGGIQLYNGVLFTDNNKKGVCCYLLLQHIQSTAELPDTLYVFDNDMENLQSVSQSVSEFNYDQGTQINFEGYHYVNSEVNQECKWDCETMSVLSRFISAGQLPENV